VSDYQIQKDDHRWKYGVPPSGNANYAWLQHFISKLAPGGTAGIVLANGSMSSDTNSEGEIRKNLIENDLVDCMVSLPTQLFYNTQIPACLWFLSRNKTNGKYRNHSGHFLFIDAREIGTMINRRQKELSDEDIAKIGELYHNWRSKEWESKYKDVPGLCQSVSLEEVSKNNYILTPGRYVQFKEEEDDGVGFEEKMKKLTLKLTEQINKSKELDVQVLSNLSSIGFNL
jgi:type I restriction enzyme M protein